MAAPHAHNDIEINLCASSLTYESGGAISTLPPGVPCVFWGARPHQLVDIADDEPLAFVTIPLAVFLSWAMPAGVVSRLLRGEILIGRADEDDLLLIGQFERWARDLHARSEALQRATLLEVESLMVRLSLGTWSEAAPTVSHASIALTRAAEMALFITANAGTRIRVRDVAEVVHLHPNRAAAVFREVFGVSITQYLGQIRVAEAQRLLVTTDLDSAQIGVAAGFQSPSSFHETFVSACRVSPTQWRRQNLGGASRYPSPGSENR